MRWKERFEDRPGPSRVVAAVASIVNVGSAIEVMRQAGHPTSFIESSLSQRVAKAHDAVAMGRELACHGAQAQRPRPGSHLLVIM